MEVPTNFTPRQLHALLDLVTEKRKNRGEDGKYSDVELQSLQTRLDDAARNADAAKRMRARVA